MKISFWATLLSWIAIAGLNCATPTLLAANEPAAKVSVSGEARKLPTAAEVLERFGKAIGGKETFRKIQSQQASGTVEMAAQGINGKMQIFAQRPDKMLMIVTIPGVGDLKTGFDGKVGWMSSALTGPMLLEGKMRDQLATQADFDHALHDPSDYKSMEVLGVEEFNGEECYKLKLSHRSGYETTEFFSTKTGLQRGFLATQDSPLGPITATSTVLEYKQFGDLLMPSKISQKAVSMETTMTMIDMKFDQVDPSIFDMPEDVKALSEKPASTPDDAIEKPKEAPKSN